MPSKENSVVCFLFINNLNKLEQVWFNRFQSYLKLSYWKWLRTSVILISKCIQFGWSLNCKADFCWNEILKSDLNQFLILQHRVFSPIKSKY